MMYVDMYRYKYFQGPLFVLLGHVALAGLIVEQVERVYGCSGDDRDADHSDVCMVLLLYLCVYVCTYICMYDLCANLFVFFIYVVYVCMPARP